MLKNKLIQLLVLNLAVIIVSVDATALDIAIPTMQKFFHPSSSALLWILDIYNFMIAGFLLPFGGLSDRVGSKKVLLYGVACFGITSLIAAYATNVTTLILARALQGIAAAGLMPATLALIRTIFPQQATRQKAIGIWNAFFYAGGIMGPLIGAYLLEHFWWGSIFLVNVPIIILLLILGSLSLPETKLKKQQPVDLIGTALSITTLLPLIYVFKNMLTTETTWAVKVPLIGIGLISAYLFIKHLKSPQNTLLDTSLFKNTSYVGALSINLLTSLTTLGILFYITQYLQLVLDKTPLAAALVTLPATIIGMLASIWVGNMATKYSHSWFISGGLLCITGGCLLLTYLHQSPILLIIIGVTIIALGNNLVDPITNNVVISVGKAEQSNSAAALSETSYELGAALGVAILGGATLGIYKQQMQQHSPQELKISSVDFTKLTKTLGEAKETLPNFNPATGEKINQLINHSYVNAIEITSLLTSLTAAFGLFIYLYVYRNILKKKKFIKK